MMSFVKLMEESQTCFDEIKRNKEQRNPTVGRSGIILECVGGAWGWKIYIKKRDNEGELRFPRKRAWKDN